MKILLQDSAQRTDSVTVAATLTPMQEQRLRQNIGYLQAVYVEAVLLFGGYWLLLHRRTKRLRDKQANANR